MGQRLVATVAGGGALFLLLTGGIWLVLHALALPALFVAIHALARTPPCWCDRCSVLAHPPAHPPAHTRPRHMRAPRHAAHTRPRTPASTSSSSSAPRSLRASLPPHLPPHLPPPASPPTSPHLTFRLPCGRSELDVSLAELLLALHAALHDKDAEPESMEGAPPLDAVGAKAQARRDQ